MLIYLSSDQRWRILEEIDDDTPDQLGYILERWNPTPNVGWEQYNSMWGFKKPDLDIINLLKNFIDSRHSQ